MTLTTEERAVWTSAYAAAFTRGMTLVVDETGTSAHMISTEYRVALAKAARCAADEAVLGLREIGGIPLGHDD